MLSKRTLKSALGVAAALGLATSPTVSLAAGFTPEGASHWVSVAHALVDASNAGTEQMGTACKGVSIMGGGSEIRKESSQVPKWAVMAHFDTCIAFNSLASRERGKGGFMSSTRPCKNLKAAVDELGKAQQGVDPDDVVAAASQLRTTLQSLVGDFKDAKTCKFGKVGLF
jgi:hypothetical protein